MQNGNSKGAGGLSSTLREMSEGPELSHPVMNCFSPAHAGTGNGAICL